MIPDNKICLDFIVYIMVIVWGDFGDIVVIFWIISP